MPHRRPENPKTVLSERKARRDAAKVAYQRPDLAALPTVAMTLHQLEVAGC